MAECASTVKVSIMFSVADPLGSGERQQITTVMQLATWNAAALYCSSTQASHTGRDANKMANVNG